MTVKELNILSDKEAYKELEKCCVAKDWINEMIRFRPYNKIQDVFIASDIAWKNCNEADYLEAFKGHPKIGDISTLSQKYANTTGMAENEQSGIAIANDEVIRRLATGNQKYEDKFGFIFIVCASGKTAQEMLSLLEERIVNDASTELRIAASEQHKITTIRLEKLLE